MNLSEIIFKGYVPIVLSWLFPILTLFVAAFFEPNIQIGVLLLLLLAIVVGMLIPGIVISWLIIGLTTVGAGVLLFGYLVIPVNGLKSIFETAFKRHSEPRLPSTAQINH
ncbi:helix-turn-helix domain-containing protein [Lactiplantibacillus plantarum]|nr:helix-turn-helix domain-containing protein [Lactiplantibacillus plantarum]MCG0942091.1 helix-turn-helix domain-containing protein [Lactiplantibacillus plantarum]